MLFLGWAGIICVHAQQPYSYQIKAYHSSSPLIPVYHQGWYGYINYNGDTVIPFRYRDAWPFSNGFAVARTDSLYGYINPLGQTVIPMLYEKAQIFGGHQFVVRSHDAFLLLDTLGHILLEKKCDGASSDGAYMTLFWDKKGEKYRSHVVLVGENRSFKNKEVLQVLSPKRYLIRTKKRHEIWDEHGNTIIQTKPINMTFGIVEKNGYVLTTLDEQINEKYETVSLLLYSPNGTLIRKITVDKKYVFEGFKVYPEAVNPLFVVELRPDHDLAEDKYLPAEKWLCDWHGNLMPMTIEDTLATQTLPFELGYIDDHYVIHYPTRASVDLPKGAAYYPYGNFIGITRMINRKMRYGLMNDSLQTLVPTVAFHIKPLPWFPEIIEAISNDSLWYINPSGKIIWRHQRTWAPE